MPGLELSKKNCFVKKKKKMDNNVPCLINKCLGFYYLNSNKRIFFIISSQGFMQQIPHTGIQCEKLNPYLSF